MIGHLTERQQRIAALIADGFSDKVIAELEQCDEETVGYHIRRMATLLKLDRSKNIRVQITKRVAEEAA